MTPTFCKKDVAPGQDDASVNTCGGCVGAVEVPQLYAMLSTGHADETKDLLPGDVG